MTDWAPATEAELAMRDALRAGDQEMYFRVLAGTELLLPVSADALAGRAPMGWGTWTSGERTHVLAFTSPQSMAACLAEHAGSARRIAYQELAQNWPNLDWWLAVNPGLPIEGYLPAWFVNQLVRGDVRLPGRGMGARARVERVESFQRTRAVAAVPSQSRELPTGRATLPATQNPAAQNPAAQFTESQPPASAQHASPAQHATPAQHAFPAQPVSPAQHAQPAQQPAQGAAGTGAPRDAAADPPPLPRRTTTFGRSPVPGAEPLPSPVIDALPSRQTIDALPSRTTYGTSRGEPASTGGSGDLPRRTSNLPSVSNIDALPPPAAPPGDAAPAPPPASPVPHGATEAERPGHGRPSGAAQPDAASFQGPVPHAAAAPPAAPPLVPATPAPPVVPATPARPATPGASPLPVRIPSIPPPSGVDSLGPRPTAPGSAAATGNRGVSPAGSPAPSRVDALSRRDAASSFASTPSPPEPVPPAGLPGAPNQPRPAAPRHDAAFEPANEVETSLLAAAEDGHTDSFLSTLLLARVLIRVAPGTPGRVRPGDADFPWITETADDQSYVVVFTSLERLLDHVPGGTDTVAVKFVQLIRHWPDERWSFSVNPGTPVGAKLPGAQIVALANWAADVGLDGEPTGEVPAEDFLPARAPAQPPVPAQPPAGPTMMQKVVPPEQVNYYLDRGYDRVSGFVHRAAEVAHLRTPADLFTALGLNYAGSPFVRNAEELYVLRWAAHRPNLYRIPYGGQHEAGMRAMQGWVIERAPFRGNGFAPGDSGDIIAEFKVDSVRLPHGTQLWRVGADGVDKLVATLDADGPHWRRVEPEAPDA